MSSNHIVLEIKNISKSYKFFDSELKKNIHYFFNFINSNSQIYSKKKYAVDKISFSLKKHDSVGLIGINGSGKSTLLKIIAGIIKPDSGHIISRGKIASLIELGAGFNHDFSGRENILLTGILYGLTEDQILSKIDQIIKFADIGNFIDEPVKIYSSGMIVRLAFSIIVYLDFDILLIDEALAVGDIAFVQKCLYFIREFMKKGTIILVSHDISLVNSLCNKCAWIDNAKLIQFGDSADVTSRYLKSVLNIGNSKEINSDHKILNSFKNNKNKHLIKQSNRTEVYNNLDKSYGWKSDKVEIHDVNIYKNLKKVKILKGGELVSLVISFKVRDNFEHPIIGFLVRDRLGQDLFGENTLILQGSSNLNLRKNQIFSASFQFEFPNLKDGDYSLMCSFANGTDLNPTQYLWLDNALIFKVHSGDVRWGSLGINKMSIKVIIND